MLKFIANEHKKANFKMHAPCKDKHSKKIYSTTLIFTFKHIKIKTEHLIQS